MQFQMLSVHKYFCNIRPPVCTLWHHAVNIVIVISHKIDMHVCVFKLCVRFFASFSVHKSYIHIIAKMHRFLLMHVGILNKRHTKRCKTSSNIYFKNAVNNVNVKIKMQLIITHGLWLNSF